MRTNKPQAYRTIREYTMTTEQAAEWLDVCSITLQAWCRKGTVPHLRMGNKNRFKEADLEAFVERNLVDVETALQGKLEIVEAALKEFGRKHLVGVEEVG